MTSLKELLGLAPAGAAEVIPISEFLAEWANDTRLSDNAAGRLLRAIGEPTVIDTTKDERMNRIFAGRTIRLYPGFRDFYGIELTIEEIVQNLRSAASGLIAARRIQFFVGPPGSGKSSLTTRVRELAEQGYMPVLAVREGSEYVESPVYENPLGLFQDIRQRRVIEERFKIPTGRFGAPMSFWAAEHLRRFGNDPTEFFVKLVKPSQHLRIGIAKVAPGNSKRGDLSALIGAVKDGVLVPSGGLNVTTQGLLELVEMFGGDATSLEPLIGATQDDSYQSAGAGELPHQGVIIAHANEPSWDAFKKKGLNDGLLSRIQEIRFPLCIRASEIAKIHAQYVARSDLKGVHITPGAFEISSMIAALARVKETSIVRVRMYDGEVPPSGKEKEFAVEKLMADAGNREGMSGVSERDMFGAIDRALREDPAELGLDEVTLYRVLERAVSQGRIPTFDGKPLSAVMKHDVMAMVNKRVSEIISRTYIEKHAVVAVSKADRYFELADIWLDRESERTWKDPETDQTHGREWIDQELSKIERAGLPARFKDRPKDLRHHVVSKVLHHRARQKDPKAPVVDALEEDIRTMFDKAVSMESGRQTDSFFANHPQQKELEAKQRETAANAILAVIRFGEKPTKELQQKHDEFVARMCAGGYTPRQVRRFVDWYIEQKLYETK
jgi:serine protein kinase